MSKASSILGVLIILVLSASGCFGGKKGGGGDSSSSMPPSDSSEVDPSTGWLDTFNQGIGNKGYRITGGYETGTVTALGNNSAVELSIKDVVQSDADWDLEAETPVHDVATFTLNAAGDGLSISASLKLISTDETFHFGQDLKGGVASRFEIFGGTGIGPASLPTVTAYMFGVGEADIQVNGASKAGYHPVLVAVTEGMRNQDTQALESIDPTDLEVHVIFFGDQIEGRDPVPGVPEGNLYYYFETVGVYVIDPSTIGDDLIPPQPPNEPPDPIIAIRIDNASVSEGTKEADNNLTVQFDGSLSSDDGTIQAWGWRVYDLNATGVWITPREEADDFVAGEITNYNFTTAGPKLIELTVRDDDLEIRNVTTVFYVNRHNVLHQTPSNLQPAGGGPSCQPSFNCFDHSMTIVPGVESARLEYKHVAPAGAEPPEIHIDVYLPDSGNPPNAGPAVAQSAAPNRKVLDISKEDFDGIYGPYRVWVWWTAGATVSYDLDVFVKYSPTTPA